MMLYTQSEDSASVLVKRFGTARELSHKPFSPMTKRRNRRRRIDRCTCLPFATRCVHQTVRVFSLNINPGVECAFPPAAPSPVRHWHWLGHSPCLIDPQDCQGQWSARTCSCGRFVWMCVSVVAEFSLWPGRYTFHSDLQALCCAA